ncbi:MAG: arylesterase [Burkholderiales bacterium]|nr:arylesterase [Burkholderiales bacterium]
MCAPARAAQTLLVYGDSVSAAYGIAEQRGWVALLAARLKRERADYIVVNASISGETTAGGLARLPKALAAHRPAIVVLALGGNDGLRGLPVAQMRQNLVRMIEQCRSAGARVLVAGMRLPPNYGPDYTRAFEAAFAEAAKAGGAALLPFLFEGFGERDEYFQPDRIHPNEAAQPLIAENVLRALRPLLGAR